jgi:zinc protease
MSGAEPGAFILYAGTQEESVQQVEALMKDEITRVTSEGLTAEEVERARNRLISSCEQSLQNQLTISMTCALNELYGRGYDYLFSTADRLNAITAENIKISAQSILSTNKYAMSLVLPERKD